MSLVRSTLPVVITVGAGFAGYQYVYRSKHTASLHIYDGITVDQPWRVWSIFTDIMGSEPERIISRAAKTEKIEKQSLQHAVNSARQATEMIKHS